MARARPDLTPPTVPAALPDLDSPEIRRAIAKGNAIDSGLLLTSLIQCWGGPGAFARDVFAEYTNAKSGGLTRQKILEMVSRLTIVVTNQELAKPVKPEDMTDAELIGAFRHLAGRMEGGGP